jgi:hypothetical protein
LRMRVAGEGDGRGRLVRLRLRVRLRARMRVLGGGWWVAGAQVVGTGGVGPPVPRQLRDRVRGAVFSLYTADSAAATQAGGGAFPAVPVGGGPQAGPLGPGAGMLMGLRPPSKDPVLLLARRAGL